MSLSPPSSSRCLLGVDPPLPSISSMIPTVDEIDGNGDANSVTPRKKMTKAAAPPPRLLPLRAPLVVVVVLIVRVLVLNFCIFLFVCLFVCFRRGNEYLKAYSSERAKTLLFPGVTHFSARVRLNRFLSEQHHRQKKKMHSPLRQSPYKKNTIKELFLSSTNKYLRDVTQKKSNTQSKKERYTSKRDEILLRASRSARAAKRGKARQSASTESKTSLYPQNLRASPRNARSRRMQTTTTTTTTRRTTKNDTTR